MNCGFFAYRNTGQRACSANPVHRRTERIMDDLMTNMLTADIKRKESNVKIDMYKKQAKGQSINSFAEFCQTVENSEILSKALEEENDPMIDKIIELYQKIGKAF